MRFLSFKQAGIPGLATKRGDLWLGLRANEAGWQGDLDQVMSSGAHLRELDAALARGNRIDVEKISFLPPLQRPTKILCVGLNYADHTNESPYQQPSYPTVFPRFNSSLIAHGRPIVRPRVSEQLDYEGELVAVIGKRGRHISKDQAHSHICAYSIFNEASVRDYQFKSPQWTVGKNFDDTGAFGPILVSADELPPGAKGLRLETRLNGETVQSATTSDMLFDVATVISLMSEAMTLEPGDIIVTGTPAGVGVGRKPPLWMKAGDLVEVEIEGIGILANPVVEETDPEEAPR
jgi:acylpyruvate hydrolase